MNSERLFSVMGQKWFTEMFVLVLVCTHRCWWARLYLRSRQLYIQIHHYAPINMKPHLPPPGTYRGRGGDLTLLTFIFSTYRANPTNQIPKLTRGDPGDNRGFDQLPLISFQSTPCHQHRLSQSSLVGNIYGSTFWNAELLRHLLILVLNIRRSRRT